MIFEPVRRWARLSIGVAATLACGIAAASAQSNIVSRSCPYSCASRGLEKELCRDWRINDLCYVEDLRPHTAPRVKLCTRSGSATIHLRTTCRRSRGEVEISLDSFRGEAGAPGPAGAAGPAGAPGNDGSLRMYGDGSAGSRTITTSTLFSDSNTQYTDFSIAPGATLTVPSGTIIRCTGSFLNEGNITVLPALHEHPRFAESGKRLESLSSGGNEAPGGDGGNALNESLVHSLVRIGLSGGGTGFLENGEGGSAGGGNFTVLCRGPITNTGTIQADGNDAATLARGGGGGGFIILGSQTSTTSTGTLRATGGNGAALRATDGGGQGQGPGGGGGGGIVHCIAPSTSISGPVEVTGGIGGPPGGAGSITGFIYLGGGGGGGAGGRGGNGGAVNPGGIANDSTSGGQNGAPGLSVVTDVDPTSLF